MVELSKARIEDLEKIIPLFHKFGLANEDKLRKLFSNPWNSQENYIGYKLEDGDKVVGFLGYVFWERQMNSKTFRFCNISGWVIDKDYRKEHKLKVLEPVTKLKDYTVIGLNPTPPAYKLERRIGFEVLEDAYYIFPSVPSIRSLFVKKVVITDTQRFKEVLSPTDFKVFSDHKDFKSYSHFVIQIDGKYIYVVAKTKRLKGLSFASLQYIGALDLFLDNFGVIRSVLGFRLKYAGLIIEKRFLKNRHFPFGLERKLPIPNIYMSDQLEPFNIDYLYTERFVLYD